MTCKDCVHYDVCYLIEHYGADEDKACVCKYFKNKADFVEVVRCKDCKKAIGEHPLLDEKFCVIHDCSVPEDYYCASGERKDKDA